jgi:hypothetical protein
VSGQRHAPRALHPGIGPPGTHWTGGWMGPRAVLDTDVRGKILLPVSGIEPQSAGCPVHSQTLYRLSYSVPRMTDYQSNIFTTVPATRHGGAWGERRYSSYLFLTSALDRGEWSASRPGRVLPRGKDPGTHWTGGWVGPRTGLDTEVRGKSSAPARDRTPIARSSSP